MRRARQVAAKLVEPGWLSWLVVAALVLALHNLVSTIILLLYLGYIPGYFIGEARAYDRGLAAGEAIHRNALTQAYSATWERDLKHLARLRHQQAVREAAPWN